MNAEPSSTAPLLSGLVIHWYDEAGAEALAAAWPDDERFELLVVNNGARRPLRLARGRAIEPGANLGFAAAVNLGVAESHAPLVLILNADVRPLAGALEALIQGFDSHPEAAGLVPRLLGRDGKPQACWQLKNLPSLSELLAQSLLMPAPRDFLSEPEAGTLIEQPAGAALALRRTAFAAVGGMDESFYPAWFEDVDLARRMTVGGQCFLYWPSAIFEHGLGATVNELGYARFLWIYQRNLDRYLGKHFGLPARFLGRGVRALGAALRALLLPLRRPRRAASRAEALRALAGLFLGTLSGWRRPRSIAALADRERGSATTPRLREKRISS